MNIELYAYSKKNIFLKYNLFDTMIIIWPRPRNLMITSDTKDVLIL